MLQALFFPITAQFKSNVLRFTQTQRLKTKSQFDAVYKDNGGRRLVDVCFSVLARPNEVGHPRLGLSVSARSVGGAVNRNRIKRVVRESFRHHQALLPAFDIVIGTRNAARDASNELLAGKLAQCWQAVIKRCAAH